MIDYQILKHLPCSMFINELNKQIFLIPDTKIKQGQQTEKKTQPHLKFGFFDVCFFRDKINLISLCTEKLSKMSLAN